MVAYYFMLYPLEWQYRRAMEISDENIIDLYIILGVFCGTLLISSLVCIAIYCHWHKNHKYSKYPLVHVFSPQRFVSDPCFGWGKLRTFVVSNRPESPGVSDAASVLIRQRIQSVNFRGCIVPWEINPDIIKLIHQSMWNQKGWNFHRIIRLGFLRWMDPRWFSFVVRYRVQDHFEFPTDKIFPQTFSAFFYLWS